MMAVSFQRKYFITLEAQYNPYPKVYSWETDKFLVYTIIILEHNIPYVKVTYLTDIFLYYMYYSNIP